MTHRSYFTNQCYASKQGNVNYELTQLGISEGINRQIYIDVVSDIYTTYRQGYDMMDNYRSLNNDQGGTALKNFEVGHRFVEGMYDKGTITDQRTSNNSR